ncbi:MAG TPA: hypothetical protein VJ063_11155 [Verrucomicrobiae bacterium]|nr:hypothetical protein [Verrucomicrobiae bacterium]
MRFDEPRHLTALRYRRFVAAVWPGLVVYGVALSALAVSKIWRLSIVGHDITALRWIGAAAAGPFAVGLFCFAWNRAGAWERKWIELREDRVRFGQSGSVKCKRVLGWSLTPEKFHANQARLRVTYKFGLARHHWAMLLDDPGEIARVRDEFGARFPELLERRQRDAKAK